MGRGVKWSEVKWSEVKWSEVKWSEVKWSEVKWSEVKWSEGHVKINVQYLWSNNIRNYVQYFLPLVLLFLCALLLTAVGLLCIVIILECIFVTSCVVFLLCVYCCLTYFSCRIVGKKSVSGRSCERPPRHRFFLVSLCLKQTLRWFPTFQVATAGFSCSPPELNFLDPWFVLIYMNYNHCHRATAHLQLNLLLLLLLLNIIWISFCCYGSNSAKKEWVTCI
jgi:hypothetical protein